MGYKDCSFLVLRRPFEDKLECVGCIHFCSKPADIPCPVIEKESECDRIEKEYMLKNMKIENFCSIYTSVSPTERGELLPVFARLHNFKIITPHSKQLISRYIRGKITEEHLRKLLERSDMSKQDLVLKNEERREIL